MIGSMDYLENGYDIQVTIRRLIPGGLAILSNSYLPHDL